MPPRASALASTSAPGSASSTRVPSPAPSGGTPQPTSFSTALPAATDAVATWNYLHDGIDHIMTKLNEGLSYEAYMKLYTASYNHCTSSRIAAQGPRSSEPTSKQGANLMGQELYVKLESYFSTHLEGVRASAEDLSDEPLLAYYTREWARYTTGAQYVDRLFAYLNRHWIKREKEEGRKNIHNVYILALFQWKQVFYQHVQGKNKLTTAVLKLIEKQRNSEVIETNLVRNVIDSLVALGLDEADDRRQNLEVYKEAFEKPFLAATEVYYKVESEQYILNNSVTEYMRKAEARLKEEEDRVDIYLHTSSKKHLVQKCEDVLVKNHSQLLQDEFQRLLDQDQDADLSRMYLLLSRIVGGLDQLRSVFHDHVKKGGQDNVQKFVGEAADAVDPKAYVEALLAVHKKNAELVTKAFRGETGFVGSLDKACREFVNRNAACPNPSKSPELLAKYADGLLKKSNKTNEDEDLEKSLNDTMTVFKYIEDKDVFQKFYSKQLAKRLINYASASDDAENSMISKLKDACGFEYTSKLSRMFQDMAVNKDLNDQFKEKMSQTHSKEELGVDFSVLVLGTSSWPLTQPSTELTMPKELIKTRSRFEGFYENKHSGRKLTWLWQFGKNELVCKYANQKYIFLTSTYQACILLQFNAGTDSLSYEDIKLGTGLNDDTLKGVLGLLVKQKVLELKSEMYELNFGFKSKKLRVPLNQVIKSDVKAESADVMKHVDEDRKLLIQAIIVRVMKSRKTLKHQALIQETVSQLSARFNPKISDVKKAIDTLLDKEYIERAEGSRDTFNYLA